MAEDPGTYRSPRKKGTYDMFRIWKSMPELFRGQPSEALAVYGITDPLVVELLSCKEQFQFGDKYKVGHTTLAKWNKMLDGETVYTDAEEKIYKVLHNALWALYRNAVQTGDARQVESIIGLVSKKERRRQFDASGNLDYTIRTQDNARAGINELEDILGGPGIPGGN